MASPIAIDLFAGGGGFTEGLKLAGYDVVFANDISEQMRPTFEKNHPNAVFIADDINNLTLNRIEAELQGSTTNLRSIDLIVGGPPCQGFSRIGTKNSDDERNALVFAFAELVNTIQPRAFVMENVSGLLSAETGSGKIINHVLRILKVGGYSVTLPVQVLNAANYGVPQYRKRVFILGVRNDIAHQLSGGQLRYPSPSHTVGKNDHTLFQNGQAAFISVEEAISDLPFKATARGTTTLYPAFRMKSQYQVKMRHKAPPVVYNHHTKGIQDLRMRRIRALREGSNKTDLPPELQAGGLDVKYRRLRYSAPAPTLTAHIGKDLSDFIHPKYDRWITVREAARLQSFPDHYMFLGSESLQLKMIGNAVPPLVACAIGYQVGVDLGLNVVEPLIP